MTERILHGKFDIDGGTMFAFMPSSDKDPRCWTVEYVRNDVVEHTETIDMIYAPVFGPDVGDVHTLNDRIEEIIVKLKLE